MRCVLLILAGCTSAARVDLALYAGDPVVETLVTAGVQAAVPVQPSRVLVTREAGLSVWESGDGALWQLSDAPHEVRAAARTADGTVIATDDDLLHHGDVLGESLLAADVGLPVRSLVARGADLWIGAADGLWLLRDGWLYEVRVAEQPITGPFAVGIEQLWVSDDRGVHTVEEVEDGWSITATRPGPAAALAADADETLWAVRGGQLSRLQDGDWTDLETDGELGEVVAGPGAAGAWARLDDVVIRVRGDEAWQIDIQADGPLAADEVGRLLAIRGEALERVTLEPVLAIVGLSEGQVLDQPTDVLLQPTAPDRVAAVEASVDGQAVELGPDPWRVVLDPELLSADAHELTAVATYDDGARVQARPVRFSSGTTTQATWEDHVEPLYRSRCSICHDGGTETVLTGRDAFEVRVEDVLAEVESGRMPLGSDPLTEAEIGLIRRWKEGGFP